MDLRERWGRRAIEIERASRAHQQDSVSQLFDDVVSDTLAQDPQRRLTVYCPVQNPDANSLGGISIVAENNSTVKSLELIAARSGEHGSISIEILYGDGSLTPAMKTVGKYLVGSQQIDSSEKLLKTLDAGLVDDVDRRLTKLVEHAYAPVPVLPRQPLYAHTRLLEAAE